MQLRQVVVHAGQPLLGKDTQLAADLEGDGLHQKVHTQIGVDGGGAGKIRQQWASRAIWASTQDMRE